MLLLNPYRFGDAPPPPGTVTSLLLHMDGEAGSTDFVDSGSNPKTATVLGAAILSTFVFKWGDASGLFSAIGSSYLRFANSEDFDLTEDFTIACYVYLLDSNETRGIMGYGFDSDWYAWMLRLDFGRVRFETYDVRLEATESLPVNQWVLIQITREGNAWTLGVDGEVVDTAENETPPPVDETMMLRVGRADLSATPYYNGYLDEVLILKGEAMAIEEQAGPYPDPT